MSKPARLLMVLGSVLLLLGVIAGVANREVLDGSRFAGHVDAIRSDPAVARQAGIVITQRLTDAAPDLTVARPLLESTTGALVSSSAFGPVIRGAVTPMHHALTDDAGDHIVLRLADVGAVLIAALTTLAPQAAKSLPTDLDVTLASFGGQDFAGDVISATHWVKLLSWLLPLLALLCFAGGVFLTRDRLRGLRAVGLGIATSGLVLAALTFVGSIFASRVDTDSLVPALGVAAWSSLTPDLWAAAAVVVAAGYVLVLGSVMRLGADPRDYAARAAAWLRNPPAVRTHRAARAALLVALGVAAVLRPLTVVTLGVVMIGFMLALEGVIELGKLLRRPDKVGPAVISRLFGRAEVRTALIAGAGIAVVAGLVIWNAQPPAEAVSAIGTTSSTACNGYDALCSRRYNQVAYPSTHNSMSAADEKGWFLAEQPTGIIGQLDAGIRVLLIDTWPGQHTQRGGVIANTEADRASALKQASDEYGQSVLKSALRLRDSTALAPVGPVGPYLCHAVCELGSNPLEPVMADVRQWMDAHPREVVTFFIQDRLSPAATAKVFDRAGLTRLVFTPKSGQQFPTLEQMIDSGHRLVVLNEKHGGGKKYPWLLQGFDYVQDTPYDANKVSQLSCKRLRGPADAPLFLVNHWLNRPQRRVSDAKKVNSAKVLGARLNSCLVERRHIPNFVSVDYYNYGALFAEVNRLNGVG